MPVAQSTDGLTRVRSGIYRGGNLPSFFGKQLEVIAHSIVQAEAQEVCRPLIVPRSDQKLFLVHLTCHTLIDNFDEIRKDCP